MAWVVERRTDAVHVWPKDDLREHEGADCWCRPEVLDGDAIIKHNSMDKREIYERGELRAS
jgi:hypothetical protein